jgi:hypothetical protein
MRFQNVNMNQPHSTTFLFLVHIVMRLPKL